MKTTKTFYALRVLHSIVTADVGKFARRAIGSNEGECGFVPLDQATQFNTVQEALALIALRNGQSFLSVKGDGFEIVRVDRTVTPGVTTRRFLKAHEGMPDGSKIAVVNPYSHLGSLDSQISCLAPDGYRFAGGIEDTPLFDNQIALVKFLARAPEWSAVSKCGAQLVRVIEETTDETTEDILTVLKQEALSGVNAWPDFKNTWSGPFACPSSIREQ